MEEKMSVHSFFFSPTAVNYLCGMTSANNLGG